MIIEIANDSRNSSPRLLNNGGVCKSNWRPPVTLNKFDVDSRKSLPLQTNDGFPVSVWAGVRPMLNKKLLTAENSPQLLNNDETLPNGFRRSSKGLIKKKQ